MLLFGVSTADGILANLERNYDSKSNYPVEFVNVPLNSPSGNFDVWILI